MSRYAVRGLHLTTGVDLGAGTGFRTLPLARLTEHVLSVDASPAILRRPASLAQVPGASQTTVGDDRGRDEQGERHCHDRSEPQRALRCADGDVEQAGENVVGADHDGRCCAPVPSVTAAV